LITQREETLRRNVSSTYIDNSQLLFYLRACGMRYALHLRLSVFICDQKIKIAIHTGNQINKNPKSIDISHNSSPSLAHLE